MDTKDSIPERIFVANSVRIYLSAVLLLAMLFGALPVPRAHAASTWTVTNAADNDYGTGRGKSGKYSDSADAMVGEEHGLTHPAYAISRSGGCPQVNIASSVKSARSAEGSSTVECRR